MPLEVHSAAEVLKITSENKAFRSWPNRGEKNRVEPVARPDFQPSFKLAPGEKVFTIGSCFARNVERYLVQLGFDLPVAKLMQVRAIQDEPEGTGILNCYTPNSILNEFRWALEPGQHPFPDSGCYFEIGPDRWLDTQLHFTSQVALERARERRVAVTEFYRTVKDCRVVFITPGLIEAWWDRTSECYMNHLPVPRMRREPDRFELHVQSYDEVLRAFTETYGLLSRHLRPDFRILFSVSPVPLTSTFRRLDVMVANAYSKSVLRAAAEAFCSRYDNVDYFPSYESVLLSSRRLAWNDDLVHPTDDIVKSNVYRMIQGYCGMELPMESPEEYASRVEARSTRLLREAIEDARKGREVIRRLERLEGLYASQQMLLEAKEAQLKQSQDTTARYLRQILERDGLLEPSSETKTKGGQA